ncbi:LysR family transcriptional regulator [Pseudomonas oleovorans]|uniref:LysR family transcriptional regulator n=2 Tax=Ectopseudomonas oleovorans TaxID=301 RepID=A0AB35L1T6_ECTOL|nr:LysR family transcriptional regulator [Pseudomonas oleovorans]MCR1828109.1 LysR family transcriptional regulator [Pseudomonas oleovorans]MDH0569013.1 LysR family transcriptional regulator [Pseudomonas oleovorans]
MCRPVRPWPRELGVALFEKSRRGYEPSETARALAEQAERAEQALDAARVALELGKQVISGTVRLTCTDAVLGSLLLPALARFMPSYPALALELVTSNDFSNVSRRDADLALRLTNEPPEHLVGRRLAKVSYVVCARDDGQDRSDLARQSWIAPDEAMPEHATALWRLRELPGVTPNYRCSSMYAVAQLARAGVGVAALPDFVLRAHPELKALGPPLAGCDTELWLLTRPDCRALRSVQTLFEKLSEALMSHG